MIEKLAKAIHDIIENDDDSGGGAYLRAARACLEALREPTSMMVADGSTAIRFAEGDGARECWQSMIDVALERKAA